MDPLPPWFTSLCENPTQVVVKFRNFFSSQHDEIYLEHLENLFGVINSQQIQSFLPEKLQKRVIMRRVGQEKRFQIIWNQFLPCLQNSSPLNMSLLERSGLYQNSAYGGENPRDLLINELSRYFLSCSMPLQESRALDCYEIKHLKSMIDSYADDLQRVVFSLFKLGPRRMDISFQNFTLHERCILFKSTALKFQKREYSWGELVYFWGKTNGNAIVISALKNYFCLDQLLIKENDVFLWSPKQNSALTFKQFIIESTLHLLFKSFEAPLPDVKSIWKNLYEPLSSSTSDEERQNLVYYVDSVFTWFQANQEFPFATAQHVLHALQGHKILKSAIYNFLHAVTHFFQALRTCKVEESAECKKFLLEAIYAVPTERRQFFDKIIEGEKFLRLPFLVDHQFVSFAQSHNISLEKWGEIILRFSQTQKKEAFSQISSCTSSEHLMLVQKIEALVGLPLTDHMVEDLLFFQTAKNGVLAVVERFEQLQKRIFDESLDTFSIPANRYSEWQKLPIEFMEHFSAPTLTFDEDSKGYKGRNDHFSLIPFEIARLLQIAVYPKPYVSFKNLIPEAVEMTEDSYMLDLSEMGSDILGKIQLIDTICPTGPLWMGQWKLKEKDMYFSISVIQSLQTMRTCTFSLKVPSEAVHNLSFLSQLVDERGIENFSSEQAKGPLIEFVRLLHTQFLKSFYLVLLDTKAPKTVLSPGLNVLHPFENGFYLQKPKGEQLTELDVIRYSDYARYLEKIYSDWDESPEGEYKKTDAFQLRIGTEATPKAWVDLHILTEEFLENSHVFVNITWTLTIGEKDYVSSVKYSTLDGKDTFIQMMVWQLGLLKQEYIQDL